MCPDLRDHASGLEDFSSLASSISLRLLLGIWFTTFKGDLRLFEARLTPFLESSVPEPSLNVLGRRGGEISGTESYLFPQ